MKRKRPLARPFMSETTHSFGVALSTRLFSFCPGRKVTTRRAVIGISSPVLGLRPGRWFLSRRSKLPKPDSLTCSPFSRARRTSSKNNSTRSLASRLLSPSFSNRCSDISALVSAIGSIPQGCLESLF
ncbi:hypothetical [Yersinia pestis KIM10+]|uniref:Uncharacterized protein n=1 Tax=Yersinia pestis TaxID=632 RepID=Q8CL78_YERPE|nr:hypothetical [Yersinia pestis KIM10+]